MGIWVETKDVKDRYTGDPYSLPIEEILDTIIDDAEDILLVKIEELEDLVEQGEIKANRVKRIVSNAVIRYLNTGSEGIVSHSMSSSGNSEWVNYDPKSNKSSVFYTEEEIKQLSPKEKKNRLFLFNMYGGDQGGNYVESVHGKTSHYTTDDHVIDKNNYYS